MEKHIFRFYKRLLSLVEDCCGVVILCFGQVNNVVVKLPYKGSCYSIDYNSNFVRLDSTFGLSGQFDGRWLVVIQVPDSYKSLTHGICGNNNGVAR
jgi:hypothetical protein